MTGNALLQSTERVPNDPISLNSPHWPRRASEDSKAMLVTILPRVPPARGQTLPPPLPSCSVTSSLKPSWLATLLSFQDYSRSDPQKVGGGCDWQCVLPGSASASAQGPQGPCTDLAEQERDAQLEKALQSVWGTLVPLSFCWSLTLEIPCLIISGRWERSLFMANRMLFRVPGVPVSPMVVVGGGRSAGKANGTSLPNRQLPQR